jgi:hypothetical protein
MACERCGGACAHKSHDELCWLFHEMRDDRDRIHGEAKRYVLRCLELERRLQAIRDAAEGKRSE